MKLENDQDRVERSEPNMDILPFVVAVAIACFLLVLSGLVRHWGMIG